MVVNNDPVTEVNVFVGLLSQLKETDIHDVRKFATFSSMLCAAGKKMTSAERAKYFIASTEVIKSMLKRMDLTNCDDTTVEGLKSLITCMEDILRSQPAKKWRKQNNRELLTAIMSIWNHNERTIRTTVIATLLSVLTDLACLENGVHPQAETVGEYFLSMLRGGMAGHRLLTVIEAIACAMPPKLANELADRVIRSCSDTTVSVQRAAFRCLYQLFRRDPSNGTITSKKTRAQLRRFVVTLHKLRPASSDPATVELWLKALTEAHVRAAKGGATSVDELGETLEICIKLSACRSKRLGETLHTVLMRLFQNCVQQNSTVAVKCLELFASTLSTNNAAVLKFVLQAMSSLFGVAKASVRGRIVNITLRRLAAMREADDDDKALVEEVFESAIRSIGMKRVFSAVSARGATANATDQGSGASLLGIDPALQLPDEIPYLWLLRLLKNSIRNESLSIFTDDLLPTVTSLHSRLVPLHPAKVELFSEIEGQIWDLLPSFLMSAPDFSEVFPKLAQKLVATFDERRDLRLAVISSIRAAIKSSANDPDRKLTMASCAKKLLPTLAVFHLNASGCDEDKAVEQAVLKVMRDYAPMATANMLASFVKGAIRRLEKMNGLEVDEEEKQVHIADLLDAVVKHAPPKALTMMVAVVRAWLSNGGPRLMKNAYKLLGQIASRVGDEALWPFFNRHVEFAAGLVTHKKKDDLTIGLRLGIYRWIFFATTDFVKARKFSHFACSDIIRCLDYSNSRSVRTLAEGCFREMCSAIVKFGIDAQSDVMLKTTFKVIDRIVSPTPDNSDDDAAKVEAVPEAIARSKLIAMRIVAERELSLFTPRQRERFVHDACAAVKDARRPIRLLAMTVICVLCERLPVVTLKKYKKSIIKSVFHPSVWNVRAVVRRCASEASERLCEALLDKFGRDDVKAAMPDRLFKLLEQRVLLKKVSRRLLGEHPQQYSRRRSVQGVRQDKWEELVDDFYFHDDDVVEDVDLETICASTDFMLRRVVNDYSACSFIVAIRALSSIGKFFIDAIKRVLDETRGQAGATRHAQSVRAILSMILDMTLKGDGDEWRRRIEQPVYMSKLRAHFAHVNGADPRLSAAVSVPVHMATDAIISLLRENDQRHFKVVTKKAYRCPHCNTINRLPSAQMGHDYHFTFSLPDGRYPNPYWRYAGRPWDEFDVTEKELSTTHQCVNRNCGQQITGVGLRERPEKPMEFNANDPDKDPQHRYLFVFYSEGEVDGMPFLSVKPQLMDAFHAYPDIGQTKLNVVNEWDCRLVGYGLGTERLDHIVYRYHYRNDKVPRPHSKVMPDDLFYHIDEDEQYGINEDAYLRDHQSVYFALYQFMNKSSQQDSSKRNQQGRFDADAFKKIW